MDRDFKTFRFRLRAETTPAHQKLEARLAVSGLSGRLDNYCRMLAAFLSFYRPVELALLKIDWQGQDLDIFQRMKTDWLLSDLKSLGVPVKTVSDWPRIPPLTSAFEGLGALYVLEGASLGGQVISRRLQGDLGIGSMNGGRFFLSYGDRVGEMWRTFLDVLEKAAQVESNAQIIERAAVQTFECFDNCMESSEASSETVRVEAE